MEYNYYLFKDKNYGSIYTNNEKIYNKKLKNENNNVLKQTFFKVMFLCLAITLISITSWAIFEAELLLWISFTFLGLTSFFALLCICFVIVINKNTLVEDFKLTKEYADQVAEYKAEKNKQFIQKVFAVIKRYNELESQHKEEEEKTEEEKLNEVIVKIEEETMKQVMDKVENIVKENFYNVTDFLRTAGYMTQKTEINTTIETKEEKPLTETNTTPKTKENKTEKEPETKVEIIKNSTKRKTRKGGSK